MDPAAVRWYRGQPPWREGGLRDEVAGERGLDIAPLDRKRLPLDWSTTQAV